MSVSAESMLRDLISENALIFYVVFSCVYIQVASFTGEKQAVSDYSKFLVDAYKSGVREGSVAGMGFGTVMFVFFCGYAMAVWFGAKMILEKGYNGGTVINVIVAILTASM